MANVLVVDDSRVMRSNLKIKLEKLGHNVVAQANNGYEGIEEYKKCNPDFVTMDITMPSVNKINDGIDAVEKIKEYDKNAKVIMITSHGEEEKILKAIEKGAKNYILKPISPVALQKAILKLGF